MAYSLEDYEITKDGEVINKHNGHIRKPQKNSKGYLRVRIAGKNLFVHRLVAEKYIPNPENKEQVNHKDGNKTNNKVENLEWVTNQENREHAIKNDLHLTGEKCSWAKLNEEKIKQIRQLYQLEKYNITELSLRYGVSRATIRAVINYESWKKVK